MTSVAVTGASGMLGKRVVSALIRRGYETAGFSRESLDITNRSHLAKLSDYDVVINCAGVREGTQYSHVMVDANAYGPHLLAHIFRRKIIHVSTDCVFGGMQSHKKMVAHQPDPTMLYGRTKLAGESPLWHVVNVRTSFIGFEHGLLKWLIGSSGMEVSAFTSTSWSGSDVWTVADALVDLVERDCKNVEHLATEEEISKAQLLRGIVNELKLDVRLVDCAMPVIYRALRPTITLAPVNYERLRDEYRSLSSNTSGSVPREHPVATGSSSVS